MNLTIKTVVVSCLILGATSCTKEETPIATATATSTATVTPAAQTKTELLTDANWEITASTRNPGFTDPLTGAVITDILSFTPACEKDGFTLFNTNGNYTEDEGALKCDPLDPQTTTGTWAFDSTEEILIFDGTDSVDIQLLSATTLILSETESILPDTTFTITYTKQ